MTTIAERIKKIRENELANFGIYAYKVPQEQTYIEFCNVELRNTVYDDNEHNNGTFSDSGQFYMQILLYKDAVFGNRLYVTGNMVNAILIVPPAADFSCIAGYDLQELQRYVKCIDDGTRGIAFSQNTAADTVKDYFESQKAAVYETESDKAKIDSLERSLLAALETCSDREQWKNAVDRAISGYPLYVDSSSLYCAGDDYSEDFLLIYTAIQMVNEELGRRQTCGSRSEVKTGNTVNKVYGFREEVVRRIAVDLFSAMAKWLKESGRDDAYEKALTDRNARWIYLPEFMKTPEYAKFEEQNEEELMIFPRNSVLRKKS